MDVAAVVVRNVPMGQAMHTLLAAFGLYVPAAQAVQAVLPVVALM